MKYDIVDNVKYDIYLIGIKGKESQKVLEGADTLVTALLEEGVIAPVPSAVEKHVFVEEIMSLVSEHGAWISSHVRLNDIITNQHVRNNDPLATAKELVACGVLKNLTRPLKA